MILYDLHRTGVLDALQRRAGEAFESDYLRSRRGARVIDPRRDPVSGGGGWEGQAAARRIDEARQLLTQEAMQEVTSVAIYDNAPADVELLRGGLSVLAQRVYGFVVA